LRHLAENENDVLRQMTFGVGEVNGFHRFLDKFRILDELKWTENLIDDSIASVCGELNNDGIDYALIDFSINKYMSIGWHKHEAIKFIYDRFNTYRPGGVGLILSLKYESMRASQRQYAKLIENPIAADCLVGIDLVGDECWFDNSFHVPILHNWRAAGKLVRAHVGEYGGVENIRYVADVVTNIAHGLAVINDEALMLKLRDNDISFDLGITSNFLTGVCARNNHPLRKMLDHKLKITIGTDDPVVCNTTINNEYRICAMLGATDADILQMKRNAIAMSPFTSCF